MRRALTVEECRFVSVSLFREAVSEVVSYGTPRSGSIRWSDGGTASLRLEMMEGDPWVHLDYSLHGRTAAFSVRLVTTSPPVGGVRWWFVCPLVVNGTPCRRRVSKLYLPPGADFFGCRTCYRLTYRSVQTHNGRVAAFLKDRERLIRTVAAFVENPRGGRFPSSAFSALLSERASVVSALSKGGRT